jgi:hypothetical protein
MIGNKVEHFEGKGTDLGALAAHIEEYLKNEGFSVQSSAPSAQGTLIQARKGGWMAGIVDADRALSIAIEGDPNDFSVRAGIGKWREHLAVAAIETLVLSDLFLVVDLAESLWNVEIEDKLLADIRSFIG